MMYRRLRSGLVILAILFSVQAARSQLIIVERNGQQHGCAGNTYIFQASGAAGLHDFRWSDGVTNSTQASFGVSRPTGITANDNVTITLNAKDANGQAVSANLSFVIYALPVSNFSLASGVGNPQCFEGNAFTFINQTSTQNSGNRISASNWLFGDGAGETKSDPDALGQATHSYLTTPDSSKDQCYTITLEVVDDKGCINVMQKLIPCVQKPMGVLFYSNRPNGCDSQLVKLTNISKMPVDSLKSFRWEFLDDGSDITVTLDKDACNSAGWDSVTKWMSKNGCFNARIYAESKLGCKDTFETQMGCNRVVRFNISYPNGDNICYNENARSGVTFTSNPLPGTFTNFAWVFDDPDSGPENVNTIVLDPNHKFTKVDLYRPRLIFQVPGCGQRDTAFAIFVKGPQASIETKDPRNFQTACNFAMVPVEQRYQCQITDTVFFPNLSTYFFNDGDPFNDTVKTNLPCFDDTCLAAAKKGYVIPGYMAGKRNLSCDNTVNPLIIQGSIPRYKDTAIVRRTPSRKPGICPDQYDTIRTQVLSPFVDSAILITGSEQAYVTRRNNHTTRVWDFDDDAAPRCTTDSRPIYPKLPQYNNMHMVGTGNRFPKNTYAPDTVIKAKVVDSTVITTIKPLTNPDTVNKYKYILVKNVTKSGTNNSISTTVFVKDGVPIDTLVTQIREKVDTVGTETTIQLKWVNCRYSNDSLPKHWYSPANPRCYRVQLILNDTSKPDPNILSLTTSQIDPNCGDTATIQLALMPPDASGLQIRAASDYCYDYPIVYGVRLNFSRTQPACDRQHFWVHWDSAFDRNDATPNEFDNWIFETGTFLGQGFFPPWPTATQNLPPNVGSIWNQYFSGGTYPNGIYSNDGWVTVGFRVQNGTNPATGQACVDEKWYHRAYMYPKTNDNFYFYKPEKPDSTFTTSIGCPPEEVFVLRDTNFIVQDSIVAQSWLWGDTTSTVDSFYRWDCNVIPGKCISYMKTFEFDNRIGKREMVDSVVFRIYNQSTGLNELLLPLDSIAPMRQSHVYKSMGRFIIAHQMVACQKIKEEDANGNITIKESCCNRTRLGRVAVMGFFNTLNVSDTVICKGTPVQFFDSARYFWRVPPPTCHDLFMWDYWNDPTWQPDMTAFVPCDLFPDSLSRDVPKAPYRYEQIKYNFGDGTGWREPGTVPDNPVYVYSKPGMYNAQVEYTDSTGCKAVYNQRVWVTGIMADFSSVKGVNGCQPIATFYDSSILFDPCMIELGFPCDQVTYKKWDFGDENTSLLLDDSVLNFYRNFGEYDIKLYTETGLGCKDSIVRNIILEGPQPRFDFAIDSVGCNPYTVEVRNLSRFPSPNAVWVWNWGDGSTDVTNKDTNMRHTYTAPGVYSIYLKQSEVIPPSTPCDFIYPDTTDSSARIFQVRVLDYKKVDIFASDTIVCPNDSFVVGITNGTDSIYSIFNWNMGDGTDFNGRGRESDTIRYAYPKAGIYYVRLSPLYTPPPGEPVCPLFDYQRIEVKTVLAKFRVGDSTEARPPEFWFENQSADAVEYWWNFDNGEGWIHCPDLDDCPNAKVNYGDKTGFYNVCLVAKSSEGCLDTTCQLVENKFTYFIDIPNVFTPDEKDGKNDVFEINIYNQEYYDLKIYNRWGELVFESTDPTIDWNGKKFNTGNDCPSGTYYVVLNYKLRSQKDNSYRGTLTLLRNK